MPYNPNTGVYDPDPSWFDPMAGGQTQQPGPAYNNPWYDSQFYGQQNQGGSFQPMPDYTGGNGGGMDYTNPPYSPDVFGGGNGGNFNSYNPQGVGATTQPVQYPDVMGNGWMRGNGLLSPSTLDFTQWPGYAGTMPGDPGIPVDANGHELPNPYGPLPPSGLTRPGADSVNVNGQQVGLYPQQQQQQTTASLPTPAGGTSTLPAFQRALEDPNGPYANRQVGDYAPSTAPLNVQNPQTLKDWQDRYYWFEQHQNYLTNPTAPRTQSATNPDYTMPWTVPGGSFAKNVYADSNAQQSFLELQGVLTPERLQEAQQKYGWQQAVPSVSPDQQSVYKTAIQMANADPNSDYSIVQTVGGYGILKRENGGGNVAAMQAAQSARGFISPAVAIARAQAEAQARQQSQTQSNSGGGGGGRPNYPTQQRSVSSLPSPQVSAPAPKPTPTPSIDTRMVGGQVNMNQPVEGQIINYNGQMVQYRQGRWVPLAYNGGSQQHASPV